MTTIVKAYNAGMNFLRLVKLIIIALMIVMPIAIVTMFIIFANMDSTTFSESSVQKASTLFISISVFITVLLAYTALESIEQNKRLQEENKILQQDMTTRERKGLTLERILNWAEDITVFVSKQIVENRTNAVRIINDAAERLIELNVLAAKGIYIEALLPGIFPDNSTLLADIKDFRKNINRHTGVIELIVKLAEKYHGTRVGEGIHEELMIILEKRLGAEERYAVKLRDDALELIKSVAHIYSNIK